MSLTERAKQQPTSRSGSACSVGALVTNLPSDEQSALLTMLGTRDDWGWPAGDIYDALVAEGHKVSLQQINRHRGGKCRCNQGGTR